MGYIRVLFILLCLAHIAGTAYAKKRSEVVTSDTEGQPGSGDGKGRGYLDSRLSELLREPGHSDDELTLPTGRQASGIRKDRGEITQYICNSRQVGQNALMPPGQFCKHWPGIEKKISAMARASGYPAPVMQCLYLQESGYRCGQTSGVGAQGCSQFMPGTARELANLVNGSSDGSVKAKPELQELWNNYQKLIGGNRPVSEFTADAITGKTRGKLNWSPRARQARQSAVGNSRRSEAPPDAGTGTGEDLDVMFMATTIYFRNYYAYFESDWAELIEKDPKQKYNYYRFLAIGYNGGPKRAEAFLRAIKNGAKEPMQEMPAETKGYVRALEDCMMAPGVVKKPKSGMRDECKVLGEGKSCEK